MALDYSNKIDIFSACTKSTYSVCLPKKEFNSFNEKESYDFLDEFKRSLHYVCKQMLAYRRRSMVSIESIINYFGYSASTELIPENEALTRTGYIKIRDDEKYGKLRDAIERSFKNAITFLVSEYIKVIPYLTFYPNEHFAFMRSIDNQFLAAKNKFIYDFVAEHTDIDTLYKVKMRYFLEVRTDTILSDEDFTSLFSDPDITRRAQYIALSKALHEPVLLTSM